MLLFLVVPYSHVGHEEVSEDVLVLREMDSSVCIQLGYLHN